MKRADWEPEQEEYGKFFYTQGRSSFWLADSPYMETLMSLSLGKEGTTVYLNKNAVIPSEEFLGIGSGQTLEIQPGGSLGIEPGANMLVWGTLEGRQDSVKLSEKSGENGGGSWFALRSGGKWKCGEVTYCHIGGGDISYHTVEGEGCWSLRGNMEILGAGADILSTQTFAAESPEASIKINGTEYFYDRAAGTWNAR